ncbi:sulfatase-like hydrolase/transferase [Terriglobus albidus]|uniref:sulfatase-like hydrolase/transferase n=1 Tax=Terriglobus albidus TaxID=1592106 RepID=UPI0021E03DBA|nr:sulfatase-like hydrolase/transferase [Terriglobus albidus]
MRMDRRQLLHLLALSGAGAVTVHGFGAPARKRPPNIVVILSDDVGYGDVGCYGAQDVETPHIDELAKDGIRFTNAHCDAATCTPSRYALLTGSYAWRRDGIQVLPGDAKLLIQPGQPTIASILKKAGYRTGLVGKWHIGLGSGAIDWNAEIKPGPCEVGFDEAFFFAATADRVPTVYIHDHHVVGLDPADPIQVSYRTKVGNDPTGRENPDLLKMKLSEGHDGTIVDGVSRIGFMTGGKSARWTDENMAATFTDKAVEFIENNHDRPFFLYFTSSDIHVPRMPNEQFAGKNACGIRCDVLNELDWSVGRIVEKLRSLRLEEDTIVIFSSDNGPVVNDGYDDGADHHTDSHPPAGPWRGGKYTITEGGTRIPFIVRWKGNVKPGVSDALISQLDLTASLADVAGTRVPRDGAPDSENVLPALLGRSKIGRQSLVEEAQCLALIEGDWKLIDRAQTPGTHAQPSRKYIPDTILGDAPRETPPQSPIELYNLNADPHELHNVAAQHPEIVSRMQSKLAGIRSRRPR